MVLTSSSELDSLRRYMLIDGYEMILDLEKSQGSRFYDKISKREYLDMSSFYASMPLGMNHPVLVTPEAKRELEVAARNKVANSDFYTQQMIDFVETFADVAMPPDFRYSFFIEGGALAVENALKAAFDWKVRKNIAAGKGELGSQVIHFKQAFHGRSGYTLSLTNTSDPRKHMYFPKFKWPRVSNPMVKYPIEEHLADIEEREQRTAEEIQSAFDQNPDDIAAIIIEPIQGEGGDNHFRDEFFRTLKRFTLENDALLVYDEVQTGVGLTGKMWYSDYLPDAKPDVFSFGKKMQVCGIVAGERLDEVEDNVFHESSRINSTWGGNIVDMVRSKYYLRTIKEENLLENVVKMGSHLMKRLSELQDEGLIQNVRGRGLMVAFDLKDGAERDKLKSDLLRDGMIILGCGDNSLRFRPALNVMESEIDEAVELIGKNLR